MSVVFCLLENAGFQWINYLRLSLKMIWFSDVWVDEKEVTFCLPIFFSLPYLKIAL